LGLQNDRLFKLAMELEKIALEDDYFIEKKLYPNVDFYSGIVQKALGIPTSMFTCIFALARTVGWMTQWEEMINDPEYKIGRPRQLYVGAARRDVVPLLSAADMQTPKGRRGSRPFFHRLACRPQVFAIRTRTVTTGNGHDESAFW
jgi:hypothetical protein